MTRAEVMAVACSTCGAKGVDVCTVTTSGTPYPMLHESRKRYAEAIERRKKGKR